MKPGKRFEEDFKKSIPKDVFFLRLIDSGGWSNASNTRFTPSNLCDCIVFKEGRLYLLELKSHKGKSIPVQAMKQLDRMAEIQIQGVQACMILNYREHNVTYLIAVQSVVECLKTRKSVPISWCEEHGQLIPQTLKRTRYRYDLSRF